MLHDPESTASKSWSPFIRSQGEMALSILSAIHNIDPSAEWWTNLRDKSANIMNRNGDPTEKFNVLCHGDNWTNNMLFK